MSDVTFETVAWKAIAHRDQLGDAVRFVAGPCPSTSCGDKYEGFDVPPGQTLVGNTDGYALLECSLCNGSGLVPYDLSVLPEGEVREAAEHGLLYGLAEAAYHEAWTTIPPIAKARFALTRITQPEKVLADVDVALDALGEAPPAPGG